MELFSLLQKRSKPFYFFLLVLGLVNSVWASALLLFINNKTSGTPLPFMNEYDWALYLGLIVVSFVVARYFQLYMIRLTYDLGNELGLSIFDKLRFTDYEDYLRLGEDKVRAVLTDVTTLQRFPQAFIECFNAAVMVVIGIGYLLWINPMGALIIVLFLVVLAAIYFVRNVSIQKDLSKARDMNDVYQQNVNDFLRGFKEVKMSMQRSDNLFEKHITENRNKVKDLTVRTLSRHLVNELMGNYTFYLVIGLILFLLPVLFQMSQQMNVSFIVTLLYLMGPISMLVSEIHEFTKMAIAVERIGEFNQQINAAKGIEVGHGDTTPINETFESLEFENVTYEYYDEKKAQTFRLQPLNLKVRKGESLFLTGGNGSGKSTFIHLLTGLYLPKSGTIYLNGYAVTPANYPYYRNQLSCIFTDNYLFSDNYDGFDLKPSNERLQFLINKMGLSEIIQLDDSKNKLKTTLSKGQQKRLALILSLLENKDILVLDEWAAEQDPLFREYFYKQIIPELKDMGKTVIAVTHDDAYFDCAERIVKFDFGRIASDTKLLKREAAVVD